MSKRFAWLLGAGALLLIAFLVACSSTYSSSSDGLLVVGSQGSGLLESFSFSLASGHAQEITNSVNDTGSETCVLAGNPSSIVLDKSGSFAYVIVSQTSVCPGSQTGIQTFTVNGSGEIAPTGSPISLQTATVGVCEAGSNGPPTIESNIPVVPVDLATDSSGQYLFVANAATSDGNGNAAPGAVSVFSISNGTLTEVQGSPFTVPVSCAVPANNLTTLAVSPTVFPAAVNGQLNAVCADQPPPTAEYLYVTDSAQLGQVWEFSVNTSTGQLLAPPNYGAVPSFPTGSVPSGVIVDPCNRFVYVSNKGTSNTISAYSICNGNATQSPLCPGVSVGLPDGDGSLRAIGLPFSNIGEANFPGKMVIDTYGNYLYVLNGTNNISPYKITPLGGTLSPLTPSPIATGLGSTSIALRSDDSWLFVTNFNAANVSQYAMTPSTGTLTPVPTIPTDNYPWGVAVK